MDIESAQKIFQAHGGIMQTKELSHNGIYSRFLHKLLSDGHAQKIRRGFYQWAEGDCAGDAAVIAKLFPDGVLCMQSALSYYGYSDRTPDAWHLAVDKQSNKTRFNINYPFVHPHYIPKEHLAFGVTKALIDGTELNIFDREHLICDCLRRENKMDAEIFNKAVQAYIKDPQKNIANLMQYAKRLHAENKIRKVIGIWL